MSFGKKKIIWILLGIILVANFALPAKVFADDPTTSFKEQGAGSDQIKPANPDDCLVGWFPPQLQWSICVLKAISTITYYIMKLLAWILYYAGAFLNMILAIQNTAFHNQIVVNTGWIIARDIVNIFFIFILLAIALATIFQMESYGYKRLLASLIIAALFVNFSLPITGLVIDVGNILGNTFYNHMGATQDPDLKGIDLQARDVSTAIMAGFEPGRILEAAKQPNGGSPTAIPPEETLFNLILVNILGIVIMAIAIFTFLAATFMLMARIVVLWIVMILSPFAFLFAVLPDTKSYFGEWRTALVKNTFFYPAFMFMLYLVVTMIQKGVIKKLFATDAAHINDMFASNATQAATNNAFSYLVQKSNLILSFIFLGALMIASLIVAQKMGAYGANAAASYGRKGTQRLRGYAGSAAAGGAYAAGRLANRYGVAPLSRQALKVTTAAGEVSGLKTISRAASKPFSASAAKAERDAQAKAEKQAQLLRNLPPQEAALMFRTLNAGGKAQAWKSLSEEQKTQMVKKQTPEEQVRMVEQVSDHFIRKGDQQSAKQFTRQVAVASGDAAVAMRALHGQNPPEPGATDAQKEIYQKNVTAFVQGLNDKELGKIDAETIQNNPYFRKAMVDEGKDIKKLAEAKEGMDEQTRKAYEDFANVLKDIDNVMRVKHGNTIVPGPGASEYEKGVYQKIVTDHVANMNEKQVAQISAQSISNNAYLQNAMAQRFTARDVRRVASQSEEHAQAISQAFLNPKDVVTFNTALRQNAQLIQSIRKSPGLQVIIGEGIRPAKRDLGGSPT